MEDDILLSEYKKAILRRAGENVVDLDAGFNYKFDFKMARLEDFVLAHGGNVPPNKWSYHRIGILKKGSGQFVTGIHKYEARKNTVGVIPAKMITSSKNWTPDTQGYIILFNMDFFLQSNFPHQHIANKKILSGALQPFINIPDKHAEEMTAIYDAILKEDAGNKAEKNTLIAIKVLELLIMTERLFDEQLNFEANLPAIDIIQRFSDLVETHFISERSVAFYAKELNMHPNYLNSLIRKHTGRTAKESIQNRLLLEIKYLLHSTSLSVKEIAGQLGFRDANYFSAFFARQENSSPKAYRSSFI